MFKLVAIAGKLRGQEFELNDGENIAGRDPDVDLSFQVEGVSKRHFSITVTGDVAYLKDLNSSNGTFVNGKIVKAKTVKNGDKIAIPDVIFQVVEVKEKKKIIKKLAADDQEDYRESFLEPESDPDSLIDMPIHFFKYKVMPVIHGFNEEYEWRELLAIFLGLFVVITIALTIYPVLEDSKKILLYETAKRGSTYAQMIARQNARALEEGKLDQVDTSFLDREDGIASYELFDLEGRIVRPINKLNKYISDTFSIKAREWALNPKYKNSHTLKKLLDAGQIGIARKITSFNPETGGTDVVGIIAIRFAPKSLALEATKNSRAYLESLVTSGVVALFFFGIVYYLTVRPFEELKFQLEECLRGSRKEIEPTLLFKEMKKIVSDINNLLARNRELQSDGSSEFEELEDDTTYVATLQEFLRGAGVPAMVLNSEKNLEHINTEAEDLTGIRESSSQGLSLLDVAREKGFAATIMELCDQSADNGGVSQQGIYELGGYDYNIYVTSLLGKDNFAKAFYITFIKDE